MGQAWKFWNTIYVSTLIPEGWSNPVLSFEVMTVQAERWEVSIFRCTAQVPGLGKMATVPLE